jgi:transposase
MMYHHGFFPEVYVPVKPVRQKRSLIYYRQKIVNRLTQVKNGIRALLTTQAIVAVIDDPARFKSCRQICNYVGFAPRRFQSGQMDGADTALGSHACPPARSPWGLGACVALSSVQARR